jgi:hypothetical protein
MHEVVETKKVYNLFLIGGTLFLGALIACSSVPILYQIFPNDFVRTRFIIKTLNDERQPEAIFFGNSILMAGVNARIPKESLGIEVYNLSSTGQNLVESMLYYPHVKSKTKIVVQFISIDNFLDGDTLLPQVARNFKMYGYDFKGSPSKLLSKQDTSLLMQSKIKTSIASRDLLLNYFNQSIRLILRKDLDLKGLETEKYYPNTYKKRVDEKKYEKLIEQYNPLLIDKCKFRKEIADGIKDARIYFDSKGIQYIVAISPINPDLDGYSDVFMKGLKQELFSLSKYVGIIDFSTELSSDEFVDHWHPSLKGAEKLSRLLAKELKNRL